MEKTYKFRIYPNQQQENLIQKTFGCVRYVYNRALAERIQQYQTTGRSDGYYAQSKSLTLWKRELAWLKEPDKCALQNSLKNLEYAYQSFFKKYNRHPKFKSKKCGKQSYRTSGEHVLLDEKSIKLPKLGWVKCKFSRAINGDILNITVSQSPSGKYFVSICCTNIKTCPINKTGMAIGIDMGLKDFVVMSNGDKIKNPKYFIVAQNKLAKLQNKLSRKSIGSNNYNKARIKVARQYEKVSNQRKDFLHKLSTVMIKEYDIICLEDLQIDNMKRNHKFSKSIMDVSWGEFIRQLQYKAIWYEKRIIPIDKFYPSSQICNNCGYKNTSVKDASIREWICPNCGVCHDRDVNAAINILNEGIRLKP
jgi:putative transposase